MPLTSVKGGHFENEETGLPIFVRVPRIGSKQVLIVVCTQHVTIPVILSKCLTGSKSIKWVFQALL